MLYLWYAETLCVTSIISVTYFKIKTAWQNCKNLFSFVKYLCSTFCVPESIPYARYLTWVFKTFSKFCLLTNSCMIASSKGFPTHLWDPFTTDWCWWKIFLYFVSFNNHWQRKRYQRHQGPYGNQKASLQSPWSLRCLSSFWSVWPHECKLWFIAIVWFVNPNSPNNASRRYQTNGTHKWSCRKQR